MFRLGDQRISIANKIYCICECLRNGWICVQSDDWECLYYFRSLTPHYEQGTAVVQIVRQLFALSGTSEGPTARSSWTDRCRQRSRHQFQPSSALSGMCCYGSTSRRILTQATLSAAALANADPPSGRHERLRALPEESSAAALLLEYVWRANELLAGVSPSGRL